MKKIILTITILLLTFSTVILYDRHKFITKIIEFQGKTALTANDGMYVKAPRGRWLNLDDELELISIAFYTDNFNPILRTWNNMNNTKTMWAYIYEDEPFPLVVVECQNDFEPNFSEDIGYVYYGEKDNIKIYYVINNNDLYIKLESSDKYIGLEMIKEHYEYLISFIEKAIEILKD